MQQIQNSENFRHTLFLQHFHILSSALDEVLLARGSCTGIDATSYPMKIYHSIIIFYAINFAI
ncbi:hypothetical protein SC171_11395 [Pantoea cypripedii]|uniref:hypothetical protein n=1 Tax=Pantoea cypripedii TaxID=55209 RepID=UPI002FCAD51D